MMGFREQLNQAVDFAIETNYDIHNRAINIYNDLYSHKNICVFGTGQFFESCATPHFLERFEYVGDNNPECWGKNFKGRRCLSPKEISQMPDIAVIIMIGKWETVYEQLRSMGICCYPIEWLVMNIYDTHYSNEWFRDNRNKILDTVDVFEDEFSKEVYTEAICNRIAPSIAKKKFHEIETSGEYFTSDIFSMTQEEYLVDAGAYIGDSIEELLRITNGKFGAVYAFELDSTIFKKLQKTVQKYDLSKIELYNAGVSDEVGEIEYAYEFESGKKEHIVTIDQTLYKKKITYIKMDVETFEIKALEGAKNVIRTQKPKLCISAYHYLSDLWNIPIKIKELNSQYKIFLRHHSAAVWDTDCYAYVKENE